MTDLEEGELYHYCNDYKGNRDGRSIRITDITKTRSSYSTDKVEYEFVDTGESSSISVDAFEKDLKRGCFDSGLAEDCSDCNGGGAD